MQVCFSFIAHEALITIGNPLAAEHFCPYHVNFDTLVSLRGQLVQRIVKRGFHTHRDHSRVRKYLQRWHSGETIRAIAKDLKPPFTPYELSRIFLAEKCCSNASNDKEKKRRVTELAKNPSLINDPRVRQEVKLLCH